MKNMKRQFLIQKRKVIHFFEKNYSLVRNKVTNFLNKHLHFIMPKKAQSRRAKSRKNLTAVEKKVT